MSRRKRYPKSTSVVVLGASRGAKPSRLPRGIPNPHDAIIFLRGAAERKRIVCTDVDSADTYENVRGFILGA